MSSELLDIQMAAADSVQLKISNGLELLKASQINNLILREGYPVEGEMVSKGEIVIQPCATKEVLEEGTAQLTREEMKSLAKRISTNWESEIKGGGIDGLILGDDGTRFRANVFLWGGVPVHITDQTTGLLGCMIRVIPNEAPSLDSLNLPNYMRVLADANYGLLLVTGPTGSGKTSTAASYIEHLNRTRVGHIVKIEDPIEYQHVEKRCRITAREIGNNVASFEIGVKDAMRELPLAIAVGEIRDQETLIQTLKASRSGHYVTATRHAPSLVSSIRALVEDMPGDAKANAVAVSETLLGVIFQVCVPGIDDRWHFVHEVMNVTNNPSAKDHIAKQEWAKLATLLEPLSPSQTIDDRMACSLNENLANMVGQKLISPQAADRRTYDRTGLRHAISAKIKGIDV